MICLLVLSILLLVASEQEFEAEKPVLKRVKPEPVKPVVYDEKTAPNIIH